MMLQWCSVGGLRFWINNPDLWMFAAHAQAASSTVKAQSVHQPVISLSSHALLTGNVSMAHKSVTACMTAVIDQMKKTAVGNQMVVRQSLVILSGWAKVKQSSDHLSHT